MMGDANLQVWLDAHSEPNQTVLVPYVRSVKDLRIRYRLDLVRQYRGSTSRINQQGLLMVLAAQPTEIGRISVGPPQGAGCSIELVLQDDVNDGELGKYHFECPR